MLVKTIPIKPSDILNLDPGQLVTQTEVTTTSLKEQVDVTRVEFAIHLNKL